MKRILLVMALLLATVAILAACGSAVQFKLNFIVDGEIYATIDTSGNEAIKLPENPTKEGEVFDGWYWDKDTWQKPFTANSLLDAPLSSDMNIYAKWKSDKAAEPGESTSEPQIVTVTFNSNGGNEIPPQNVLQGEKITLPDSPEKSGYAFIGWTYQGEDWSLSTAINTAIYSDIILEAKWEPAFIFSETTIIGLTEAGKKLEKIVIPEEFNDHPIESIAEFAFENDIQLKNIVIPNSITSIGYGAFCGCFNLESMTIPFIGLSMDDNYYYHYTFGCIFGESDNSNEEMRRIIQWDYLENRGLYSADIPIIFDTLR